MRCRSCPIRLSPPKLRGFTSPPTPRTRDASRTGCQRGTETWSATPWRSPDLRVARCASSRPRKRRPHLHESCSFQPELVLEPKLAQQARSTPSTGLRNCDRVRVKARCTDRRRLRSADRTLAAPAPPPEALQSGSQTARGALGRYRWHAPIRARRGDLAATESRSEPAARQSWAEPGIRRPESVPNPCQPGPLPGHFWRIHPGPGTR